MSDVRSGSAPTVKAFGAAHSITYSDGGGSPAPMQRFSTTCWSCGSCSKPRGNRQSVNDEQNSEPSDATAPVKLTANATEYAGRIHTGARTSSGSCLAAK